MPYTVVGVMPPRFHYPDDVDVWERLGWDFRLHTARRAFSKSVARLSDDTTPDRAVAAVDALSLRLQAEFASTNKGWSVRLVPLLDETLGYYRPALIVLVGAVALLLVDRVPERGVAAAGACAVARARDRRAHHARRDAAATGRATARRELRPLGRRCARRFGDRRRVAAAHRLAHAGRHPAARRSRPEPAHARPRPRRHRRDDAVLRVVAQPVAPARTARRQPAERRARQLARRPPHLLGAGGRRSGARVRAARELGAAGADRRRDDAHADRA